MSIRILGFSNNESQPGAALTLKIRKINLPKDCLRKRSLTKALFSAECTIGMVWGLTALKHYCNFNVCLIN